MRVTKWSGDIALEAECSICELARFKVAEWNSGEPLHQPDRQHYQDILQEAFESHRRVAHGVRNEKDNDGTKNA